jgi:DNA polymerase family B
VKLYDDAFSGAFDRLSVVAKERNIVAFDTEDDTRGKPMAFAFHDGGKHIENSVFYTTSAKEAVEFIYNYPTKSFFVSHNLEYDLGNLFKHCDFVNVEEIVKAPLMLQVTLIGTEHVLMNSLSYFKGSLRDMGKLIGCHKLEGDAQSQLNPAYVKRDAEIVFLYMTMFQKRLVQDFGIPLSLSIGSIAMNSYRSRFMEGNVQATYNHPLLVDEGYYGGRVEVFHRGIVRRKIYIFDINSSYPNVMRNFAYPDTNFLEKSKLATHKFGVGHFKVTVPPDIYVPCLPLKSTSGRLFFPVGDFTGFWTYQEIRKAVSQGARVLKEYDGVGTNAECHPFREFVDFFYTQRQKCKKDLAENPKNLEARFESEFLKNIMNNLYGKFCQHKPKSKLCRKPQSEYLIQERLGNFKEKKIGSFWEYVQEEGHPPKTANYLWGIYTTAYARLELLRHFEAVQAAGGELIYGDTDSIMCMGPADDPAGSRPFDITKLPVSDALGDLSCETYDMGIFRQAKGYLLLSHTSSSLKSREAEYTVKKVACKGVATTHAYEFIIEGAVTRAHHMKRPMRFKEALVSTNAKANKTRILDEIGFNIWRDVPKSMRAIDVKRTGGWGKTYPVLAADIETLEENATMTAEDWTKRLSVPVHREKHEDHFSKVQIPEGWFKETGLPKTDAPKRKKFFIRRTDLRAVHPGMIWFSGDVERSTEVRGRKCLEIILCAYFGEFFTHRAIVALLPLNTLKILIANEKKVLGKRIIVSMDEGGEASLEVFNKKGQKTRLIKNKIPSDKENSARMAEFLTKRGIFLTDSKKDFTKDEKKIPREAKLFTAR